MIGSYCVIRLRTETHDRNSSWKCVVLNFEVQDHCNAQFFMVNDRVINEFENSNELTILNKYSASRGSLNYAKPLLQCDCEKWKSQKNRGVGKPCVLLVISRWLGWSLSGYSLIYWGVSSYRSRGEFENFLGARPSLADSLGARKKRKEHASACAYLKSKSKRHCLYKSVCTTTALLLYRRKREIMEGRQENDS